MLMQKYKKNESKEYGIKKEKRYVSWCAHIHIEKQE